MAIMYNDLNRIIICTLHYVIEKISLYHKSNGNIYLII